MLNPQTSPRHVVRKFLTLRAVVVSLFAVVVPFASGIAIAASTSSKGETEPDVSKAVATRAENARLLGGVLKADTTISVDVLVEHQLIGSQLALALQNSDGVAQRQLDSASELGSISFPPGVSFPEAITQLYMAAVQKKAPFGASLGPSLPRGKVVMVPSSARGSIVIDLKAPFGYEPGSPGRRILPASIAFDPSLAPG